MNLINAVVREVIKKREFNSTIEWNLNKDDELFDVDFIEFECITEDMGGIQKEILTYRKSECPTIKKGYLFQH